MKLSVGQRGVFGLQTVGPQEYNHEKGRNPANKSDFFHEGDHAGATYSCPTNIFVEPMYWEGAPT